MLKFAFLVIILACRFCLCKTFSLSCVFPFKPFLKQPLFHERVLAHNCVLPQSEEYYLQKYNLLLQGNNKQKIFVSSAKSANQATDEVQRAILALTNPMADRIVESQDYVSSVTTFPKLKFLERDDREESLRQISSSVLSNLLQSPTNTYNLECSAEVFQVKGVLYLGLKSHRKSPWIKVPASRIFSKSVESCTGFDTPSRGEVCRRDCLVNVNEVVEIVLRIVGEELPKETDRTGGGYRKKVIMTSRLARGGKSTILERLRESLKENGFRPILITLNGAAKFKRRQEESESDSILRLIALQLIDHSEEELIHFACDRQALDDYIGVQPMVLLIDELNNLSVPVEADAAALLRDMFLDRKNRHLIFSTHLKDVADTINNEGASPREAHYITMPESSNVTELQRMESNDGRISCRGLTPFQAVLYGCIPSLIFSTYAGQIGANRVESYLNGKIEPSPAIVAKFVAAVVKGESMPKYLNALEMFSSVSEGGSVRWPLVYIIDILKFLRVGSAVYSFQRAANAILNVSKMDSGEDWELLVKVGIFLRMIHAHYNGDSWLSVTFKAPTLSYPEIQFIDLQPQLRSLPAIGREIESFLDRISVPSIVFFSPTSAASPQYDYFLAFTTGAKGSSSAWTVGIQTKSSEKGMSKIKPVWIDHQVVVKARPVKNPRGSTKGSWIYLRSDLVDELLGNCLKPMKLALLPKLQKK